MEKACLVVGGKTRKNAQKNSEVPKTKKKQGQNSTQKMSCLKSLYFGSLSNSSSKLYQEFTLWYRDREIDDDLLYQGAGRI